MIDKDYQPKTVEQEAQTFWDNYQSFKVTEDLCKEKFYCLAMFPYPSGQLHMGHVRNYTLADVIARYQRMQGKNVLQPIGWDAFGLPAENAALKHKVAPAEWTHKNIAHMKEQLKRLGLAYDWSRELTTCEPDYYRWEQWLFIQLYQKGLVYKKKAMVNWDPVDQTVLANEQVIDGRGWRSGALVERREISQWFLKITDYAEELLADLDKLTTGWPEQVLTMQRNWIGKSEGVELHFNVENQENTLSVYTTRVDTLFGVTYIAIAPQHPLALQASKNNPELQTFIEECSHIQVAEAELATVEKKGLFTGLYAIHPLTGEKIPLWAANFVLLEYGTGAVMAVPAHDERDFEFAQKYKLPLKPVIEPKNDEPWDYTKNAFTDYGTLIYSQEFSGLTSEEALKTIAEHLEKQEKGLRKTHFRLRDWGVSRQRYWGTPIPMVNCLHCGIVPVDERDLPVQLPLHVSLDKPGNPLANMPEFLETSCPTCGAPAERETDTFDTFMESSWYYARYASYNQDKAMLDSRANYWTPVDQYVGGIEHAVMHLLYARFFHKLMRDVGLVNSSEPFSRLLTQGMVLKDGAKMSKSKGNVVDAQLLLDQYGADTLRLFMMFASAPEQSLEWSDSGVMGSWRYLKRLWTMALELAPLMKDYNRNLKNGSLTLPDWNAAPKEYQHLRRDIYLILKQANYDYERQQFNTVISACMKLSNLLEKELQNSADSPYHVPLLYKAMNILLRLLGPIVPHITHVIWQTLGFDTTLIHAKWPKVDQEALKTDTMMLVVQVNGKLRDNIEVNAEATEAEIKELVLSSPATLRHLNNATPKRVIYIPKRVVNIVI